MECVVLKLQQPVESLACTALAMPHGKFIVAALFVQIAGSGLVARFHETSEICEDLMCRFGVETFKGIGRNHDSKFTWCRLQGFLLFLQNSLRRLEI